MKKNLPHTLTEMLEKALIKERKLFDFSRKGAGLLKITEKNDPNSPFFFVISYQQKPPKQYDSEGREYVFGEVDEQDGEQTDVKYDCYYLPSSLDHTQPASELALLDQISGHLKKWVELVRACLGIFNG